MGLRLGFHYHVPAMQKDAGVYMPGYLGRFVDSLALHCEYMVCFLHSPLPHERTVMDYRIKSSNVTLVDIGPHVSVPRRTFLAGRFTRPVQKWRPKLDALLMRGPSPLLPQMARAARPLPLIFLLVGRYLISPDDPPTSVWRREAVRLWGKWNQWQQKRLARHSLVFVNNRQLYEQLSPVTPHLYETRTTTLTSGDFYRRADTCSSPPYHLLYTGRMDRTKGILNMIEALSMLVSQGEDVVLDLVGPLEKKDNIIDEAEYLARQKGIAARVQYHGYKALGTELFSYYQNADIFVHAAVAPEGFPRTIWEAMAHSLPVVASKVGSIPDFIQNAAALVEPGNVQELAAALLKIIHDAQLRRQYIDRGFKLASRNTVEIQVGDMMSHIKKWLEKE
jgi:glycosyltransferase involved in cell wall biosynthesis